MNERMVVLLKNAAKCFDKSYSPFCHEELSKMNVTADECLDLSATISSIITEYIADGTPPFTIMDYVVSLMKTQKQQIYCGIGASEIRLINSTAEGFDVSPSITPRSAQKMTWGLINIRFEAIELFVAIG